MSRCPLRPQDRIERGCLWGLVAPEGASNVALSEDRNLTGVSAVDLSHARKVGVELLATTAAVSIPLKFGIVVSTAGGWPLDSVDNCQGWSRSAC